jgi:preprotein translocase subunit YajC
VYIIALVAILYFMMIRPQQQRQKKQQEMIESLRVGDKIVTVGGFYGSVVAIKEYSFIIKIAEDVQVELQKGSIGSLAPEDE